VSSAILSIKIRGQLIDTILVVTNLTEKLPQTKHRQEHTARSSRSAHAALKKTLQQPERPNLRKTKLAPPKGETPILKNLYWSFIGFML
jgi:hypothetical protein